MSTRTATFTAPTGTSLLDYIAPGEPRFRKHGAWATSTATISSAGTLYSDLATSDQSNFFDDTVLSSPDVSAGATLICMDSIPAAGFAGVFIRGDHVRTDYYLGIYKFATLSWELYRVLNGGFSIRGSYPQTLDPDTRYYFRLEGIGDAITLYVDGVSRITSTDDTVPLHPYTTGGRCGVSFDVFGALGTDTTGAHLDDFFVQGAFADYNVVCDGNSHSLGGISEGSSYPAKMAGMLGPQFGITNRGVPGQTTGDMLADVATDVDVLVSTSVKRNILIGWEVTNDLYNGATQTDALARIKTYTRGRLAAGFDSVILIDVLPRSNVSTPGDYEDSRTYVNNHLGGDFLHATDNAKVWKSTIIGYANLLIRLSTDSRIGDAGDELDTTYYQDKVHLTVAGYEIVAAYATYAVNLLVGIIPGGTADTATIAESVREKFNDEPLPTYQVQRDPNP